MKVYHYKEQRPLKELLLRFTFQVMPTIGVFLYLFWIINNNLTFLHSQYIIQTSFFTIGAILCLITSPLKLRLWIYIVIFWIVLIGISFLIEKTSSGDVEPFFYEHRFRILSISFIIGWITNFLILKKRIGPLFVAIISIAIPLVSLSKNTFILANTTWESNYLFLIPIAIYGIYIVYISEQLRDYQMYGSKSGKKLLMNTAAFLLLTTFFLAISIFFFKDELNNTIQKIKDGTYADQQSMLQKGDQGSTIKDRTSLNGQNNRSKELMLLAYIDHFFEGTEVANPLYLVTFYYDQFDTATETFISSAHTPDKDLFRPNIADIPLYHTVTDSSVLEFGKDNIMKEIVEIEIYNKSLDPSVFVAPSTSYFVQPIAVDPNFQSEYKSAYRAKSLISTLNSAYFVYNLDKPEIKEFQQRRYNILSEVKDFKQMPDSIYQYYTYIPNIDNLKRVKELADSINAQFQTPIEKVIAVRDYFLRKNSKGKSIFQYTDNPGIPDIPSASKLNYFLFENRKGYCAHFAGATLFLLRSMGIPCRVTAGFLTEDRSSSNPGWYYLYADQVHAWVQVYFPGFGWIDFDTTIGNESARESEQPDATPPLHPNKATLALNGYIIKLDTTESIIHLNTLTAVAIDKNYNNPTPLPLILDVHNTKIIKDAQTLTLNNLKIGDTLTALSYDKEIIDGIPSKQTLEKLSLHLRNPIPIDHIQVRPNRSTNIEEIRLDTEDQISYWKWFLLFGNISLALFVIVQCIPIWIRKYYLIKTQNKDIKKSAYYNYTLVLYYLWMFKVRKKSTESSIEFAQKVDKIYGSNFEDFMKIYLKLKYSSMSISLDENTFLRNFHKSFIVTISSPYNLKQRISRWIQVKTALQFAWFKNML